MASAPRRASLATLLVPLGVTLALAGFLSYSVEWTQLLAQHPRATGVLKRLVRFGLEAAWYVAIAVPVVIVAGSLYRFVRVRGSRGIVFLKLSAYLVLWAAGSFALWFALFAAYFLGDGHAQLELLVPALLGLTGYLLIGLGLAGSVLRGGA
jgi:hypothetical protein